MMEGQPILLFWNIFSGVAAEQAASQARNELTEKPKPEELGRKFKEHFWNQKILAPAWMHWRSASVMATVLSRRLGKRSLLGTRVAVPDGILAASQIPEFSPLEDGTPGSPSPGSPNPGSPGPGSPNPGFPNPGSLRQLHGQQVLVTSLDEQIQGFPACWRAQDPLRAPPLRTSSIPERSVSSNIDVPKRRSDAAVEMDEMVAAMVLTSLSCSPALRGLPPSQAAGDPWKDSGDVSDSGSSTTSGHWSSAGSATASPPHRPGSATASPPHRPGSATASPPHCPGGATASSPRHAGSATASPPHCPGSATASPPYCPGAATVSPPHRAGSATASPLSDDGFDTDPEPSAPEEPAPRRRKNSAKVMFKCLWPGCGKVLRSGVGIKRHVRTQHLGDGSEREEDFYYTELRVPEEPPPELPPPAVPAVTAVPGATAVPAVPGATGAIGAVSCSAPIVIQPGPGQPGLSHSAPGSFWHIQADHAYQIPHRKFGNTELRPHRNVPAEPFSFLTPLPAPRTDRWRFPGGRIPLCRRDCAGE
ncbi:zinc finger protein 395-like [Vidua chalybeata]|uniref:zinc finger protein 395-like n=1 Tax=Vidua chalybeata TaxID=81927 RepID=UPI0023A8CB8A|nr:zinc finger protein 395-like [Vidua chalybeata]